MTSKLQLAPVGKGKQSTGGRPYPASGGTGSIRHLRCRKRAPKCGTSQVTSLDMLAMARVNVATLNTQGSLDSNLNTGKLEALTYAAGQYHLGCGVALGVA